MDVYMLQAGSFGREAANGYAPAASWLRLLPAFIFLFTSIILYQVALPGLALAQAYNSPHGGFSNSTNLCLICHAPHDAPGLKLLKRTPESALCFTCHNGTGSNFNTQVQMDLNPATNAMHPIVVNLANNTGVYTYKSAATLLASAPTGPYNCSQCHNPHGDMGYGKLLRATYSTSEYVTYTTTPDPYAACWTCHDAGKIVNDQAYFRYHNYHITRENASCSACHYSPHGVSNTELIRFNPAYVTKSTRANSGPSFTDSGTNHGSCTLTCHGYDHAPRTY
ncbi:MAG: cytochrome c3 family protein [Thermoleophilia bacterium]